ncbi:uncharacterized protein LOC100119261 isoform X2 [Nasonia vitripennis]|uniref:EGF-like domain-containing protein n=1 Tax=Nasonia vitripennis TaxID=7425 RepID=A0A7M7IVL0_NASVI|nr:uncharacterized protein LOC100119261 isoform X2 [Nasonia vitripennis]
MRKNGVMASLNWVCLLLLFLPLYANGTTSDALQASHHQSHQNHQHHGYSHHHRNASPVNWSARHNSHTAQHPHSRHNHESFLRRESRLLGYRTLGTSSRSYLTSTSATSTTTARTTTLSTSTTSSRNNVRSYPRLREQRLSAVLSPSVEPVASRSVIFGTVVHRDTHRDNYAPIYPSYNFGSTPATTFSLFQPGRRVCSSGSEASSALHHHSNRQPRLAYADLQPSGFLCCPGWTQVTRLSFGCNKHVDECVTEKPCGQICRNVPGSYECYCRSGYELQPDRQSCRKNDSDGTALEARDLEEGFEETTTTTTRRPILRDTENEVGDGEEENTYEELLRRLIKLEKQLAKGKKRETEANEIATRIAAAIDSINEIRRSIQNMQLMQQEIYELRNKVKLYEFETRKIQHLSNRVNDLENRLRLRCRTGVYFNSGSPYIR